MKQAAKSQTCDSRNPRERTERMKAVVFLSSSTNRRSRGKRMRPIRGSVIFWIPSREAIESLICGPVLEQWCNKHYPLFLGSLNLLILIYPTVPSLSPGYLRFSLVCLPLYLSQSEMTLLSTRPDGDADPV